MVCAGFAEYVEAEVAAGFGPLVVLFSEHGADEADQGIPVGKDADDVGAAGGSLCSSVPGWVVRPDSAPHLFRGMLPTEIVT